MIKTITWLPACVGLGVILWLLTSAPDISSAYSGRAYCHAVLGNDWSPNYGSMEEGAETMCTSYQTRRTGWAVLVAVPTVVLAAAGMRKGSA
ncbi:ABC-type thiamine transport system substrate-binding protein [Streptomyces canus]|uniref:hypothetical protein n=1 Tax=Streptomyces canus TaxID=58343 RepID=UPI00278A5264|nr:hypothetical protein [Streptomyces canus]MDQ0598506.1 ABC-type thiamine transport system substrate-binding protein [Streptomyces canus]